MMCVIFCVSYGVYQNNLKIDVLLTGNIIIKKRRSPLYKYV